MKRAALRSSSMFVLTVLVCAALLPRVVRPGFSAALQVDKVLQGDLTGDGKVFEVQFYHRGPIPSYASPRQPPDYVSGLVVVQPGGTILGRWEAPPSTLLLRPDLSGLWPIPPQGMLITVGVQYGANVAGFWALRWNGQKLKKVGDLDGGADFSVQEMNGRLFVRKDGSYDDVPSLYAWNGTGLVEASAQFPQYYAALGARELRCLGEDLINLLALTDCCRRALEAFSLAGMVDDGIKACTGARERIAEGAGITPERKRQTAEDIAKTHAYFIARIDELVAKYRRPVAARSGAE